MEDYIKTYIIAYVKLQKKDILSIMSYLILMLLFDKFCLQLVRYIQIRKLSQSYHDIVFFLCMIYICECV